MALAVRVPVGPALELWRADGRKIIVEMGSELHQRLKADGWKHKSPPPPAPAPAHEAQSQYRVQDRGPAWAVVVDQDGNAVTPSMRKVDARRWIEEHGTDG